MNKPLRSLPILIILFGAVIGTALGQMAALGSIVAGSPAMIGSIEMPVGGTIFQGDRLTAHKDSTVIELSNRGTIQLFPQSAIQVLSQDGQIRIRLEQGKMAFVYPKDVRTSIQSERSLVTPLRTDSRYFGVFEITATQDVVQSYEGELQVQAQPSGEKATLKDHHEACIGATAMHYHGDPIRNLRPIVIAAIIGGTITGIIIYDEIRDDKTEPEDVPSPS